MCKLVHRKAGLLSTQPQRTSCGQLHSHTHTHTHIYVYTTNRIQKPTVLCEVVTLILYTKILINHRLWSCVCARVRVVGLANRMKKYALTFNDFTYTIGQSALVSAVARSSRLQYTVQQNLHYRQEEFINRVLQYVYIYLFIYTWVQAYNTETIHVCLCVYAPRSVCLGVYNISNTMYAVHFIIHLCESPAAGYGGYTCNAVRCAYSKSSPWCVEYIVMKMTVLEREYERY